MIQDRWAPKSRPRPQPEIPLVVKRTVKMLTLKKLRRERIRQRQLKGALAEIAKFPKHADAPRHQLPGDLVISLTSYPARFPSLHLTIKSLMDQTVKPDRIVLWIAHGDVPQLTDDLRALEGDLFSIRECEDLRNFKKILPTLIADPEAFIVICDDDSYYPDHWLGKLVEHYDPAKPTIVCHRAHRLTYTAEGTVAPYRTWIRNIAGPHTKAPQTDLLATGNGGVLYPPGSLPPETTNIELIRKFSATSDDVWLYFMARKAGWSVKRVPGPRARFIEWPETQQQALRTFHRGGKKDEHIQDMCRHFGTP